MNNNFKSKKIGWIGLGAMGMPMAKNLITKNLNLLVHNRTKEKEEPIKEFGAERADSPAEILNRSDLVFLMVSDDKAVEEVFTGTNGLLHSDATGKTIINMSTISPGTSREMAKKCNNKGLRYIDAPVAGSVKQATDATLVIMVGCETTLFEEVKPLLEILGKAVFRMGDTGDGNKTKLAVNLYLAYMTQGFAEATLFAGQLGIPSEDFHEVIGAGGLNSPYTNAKGKMMQENEYPSAFALHLMAKDSYLYIHK